MQPHVDLGTRLSIFIDLQLLAGPFSSKCHVVCTELAPASCIAAVTSLIRLSLPVNVNMCPQQLRIAVINSADLGGHNSQA